MVDRIHNHNDMDRMVNRRLPPPFGFLRETRNARPLLRLTRGAGGLSPPVFQRQWQFLGRLDALTPAALVLIKRCTARSQQHPELGTRGPAGHADADGGVDWPLLDLNSRIRE